jgi:hypothetical protein
MPLINRVNDMQGQVAYLFLMTITDPESKTVINVVNNLEPVISRGFRYDAFPFEITLPPDTGTAPAGIKVQTVNVGAELMQILRGTLDPPRVKLELVLSDAPDVVEKTIDFMVLRNLEYDVNSVSFDLTSSSIFARKTCTGVYSQNEFPGLLFSLQ